MKVYEYAPQGVCSRLIHVELDDNNIITEAHFIAGCSGNTQGVCSLARGMKAEEVIARLKGIRCGNKSTSCPDQLAKMLEEILKGNWLRPLNDVWMLKEYHCKENNYKNFQNIFGDKDKVSIFAVPNGETEEESWGVLKNFSKKLKKNLEVKKKFVPLRSQTGRTVKAGFWTDGKTRKSSLKIIERQAA